MVARIWNGWTTPENADTYETLLNQEVFPDIESKIGSGVVKLELLRRPLEKEVEFTTIIYFHNWEAVKAFAGEDYHKSYIPDKAHAFLSRYNDEAKHYEVKIVMGN